MSITGSIERIGHDVRARRDQAIDALLRRMDLQPRQSALRPLLWLAVGGIAGALVVYFMAPESGRKLRERLANLTKERVPFHRVEEERPAAPTTH